MPRVLRVPRALARVSLHTTTPPPLRVAPYLYICMCVCMNVSILSCLFPLEAPGVLHGELVRGDAHVKKIELRPTRPKLPPLLGVTIVRQDLPPVFRRRCPKREKKQGWWNRNRNQNRIQNRKKSEVLLRDTE